jgi:hypothetical protein
MADIQLLWGCTTTRSPRKGSRETRLNGPIQACINFKIFESKIRVAMQQKTRTLNHGRFASVGLRSTKILESVHLHFGLSLTAFVAGLLT